MGAPLSLRVRVTFFEELKNSASYQTHLSVLECGPLPSLCCRTPEQISWPILFSNGKRALPCVQGAKRWSRTFSRGLSDVGRVTLSEPFSPSPYCPCHRSARSPPKGAGRSAVA